MRGQKLIFILIVLFLFLAGVFFYFRRQTPDEVGNLVKTVGQLIELPEGETPTIATVADKSKLTDQAFFARAQNGDKVLIFSQAREAILYRPSTGKIITVGPFISPVAPAPRAKSAGTLAVYNGTKISGLAAKAGQQIESQLLSLTVLVKANAKGDYEKSLVVVFDPLAGSLAASLSALIKAEIQTTLPSGEATPAADLLLILGQDYGK